MDIFFSMEKPNNDQPFNYGYLKKLEDYASTSTF